MYVYITRYHASSPNGGMMVVVQTKTTKKNCLPVGYIFLADAAKPARPLDVANKKMLPLLLPLQRPDSIPSV